ncbi:MAG: amidohydrolase family protein, partial [Chthonomonadaceae bacterium]|nr:amidohydrolase family protein [Chthonomonadaceae bacterium]
MADSGRPFDLLIRGGTVFDGTGAEGVCADIGIVEERIVEIGDLSHHADSASVILNANGKSVVPGFIDIHTHSDISITYDAGQASYLTQGVTTQVVGNCGLSMGLVANTDVFEFEQKWLLNYGAKIRWNTFDEFLRVVEDEGTATNFYTLAGHGSLRKRVMEMNDRPPTSDELSAMCHELETALEAGAWGFSTGLEYPPSSFANEDELAEISKVLKDYGGFYATHLRNEGDTLIESVQEALNIV